MIDEVISKATTQDGYDKEAYIQKKREQLNWAYNTVEQSIEELKNSPQFFNDYLNIQSRFDMYTPRNALLIAKQLPNAMQLKERKDWIDAKVSFKDKYPKKVIIIEPRESYINKDGKTITPYNAKELIDISETTTKPNIKSYDKKLILQGLLHESKSSNIPIKAVDDLENNKMCEWNQKDGAIYVKRTDNYDEVIKAVATEIAKINLYDKTEDIDNDKAECIAYMVCKKYGIDVPSVNTENIINKYSNMETSAVINDLTTMKEITLDINTGMGQYLDDKRKEIKSKEQER